MSLKPVPKKGIQSLFTVLFGICLLVVSCVFPLTFRGRYASPDETAVARVAERFSSGQSARISESLAEAYPWLHPRSWVSQGQGVVPVGFLGWPAFLSVFVKLFGTGVLPWVGWGWFVSSLFPFYRLLRAQWSKSSSWVGVLVMAASPMTLLYANRSLFPNPALLAGFLWTLWFIEEAKRKPSLAWCAGLIGALTVTIRPVELIWMLPWWIGRGWSMRDRKTTIMKMALATVPVLAVFFLLNQSTYGTWWQIGYWIKDNPTLNTKIVLTNSIDELKHFLPFGLHPRAIWWNLKSFSLSFLWPLWFIILGGLVTYFRRHKKADLPAQIKSIPSEMWISVWTILILLLIYGSGVYLDHVMAGAVTVGNSFLRYLLPLAPLTGVAAAYLFEISHERVVWQRVAPVLLVAYGIFGMYAVGIKDDESLKTTTVELRRYAEIHTKATQLFPPGSVILSERSDKIFGPELRSVSPLPSIQEAARLVHEVTGEGGVGLYARPLSQRDRDDWREVGIDLVDEGAFGREHLYRLIPRS